jgi:hypothetical protein
MQIGHIKWTINEDADSELRYWMNALLAALGLGLVVAVATGLAIALLPAGEAGSGLEFVRSFWPYLVECAFWLGMFVGLLWGTGKRMGASLAGTLPWQELHEQRRATGRQFGQWSAFAALCGLFLWLVREIAVAAGMKEMALFAAGFTPLATTCWIAAALFAVVALVSRRQPARRRASLAQRL